MPLPVEMKFAFMLACTRRHSSLARFRARVERACMHKVQWIHYTYCIPSDHVSTKQYNKACSKYMLLMARMRNELHSIFYYDADDDDDDDSCGARELHMYLPVPT